MVNPRWFLALVIDWAVIIGAFAVARKVNMLAVYWVASLIVGTRINALTVLGHDGAHGTAARWSWLNEIFTCLVFWPLGATVSGYRRFHFAHHKYLGTKNDPEQHTKRWITPEGDKDEFHPTEVGVCFIKDLFGYGIIDALRLQYALLPQRRWTLIAPLLTAGVLWWLCWSQWWILLLWYWSLYTSFWALFRLRTYLEHVNTSGTWRLDVPWCVKHTVSPHNIWLHYEHHQNPTIPFYRLGAARRGNRSVPILTVPALIRAVDDH